MSPAAIYRRYYGSDLTSRQSHDFYETPAIATRELVKRIPFTGTLWECACGRGAIVEVLKLSHPARYLLYSNLVNYRYPGQQVMDFLEEVELLRPIENIVTNPPFTLAIPFILRATEIARQKVVMLFRLDFLQSKNRKSLFKKTGLTDVYVFSYRLKFIIDGKPRGMVPYAWFVWDKTNPIPRKASYEYRLHII